MGGIATDKGPAFIKSGSGQKLKQVKAKIEGSQNLNRNIHIPFVIYKNQRSENLILRIR